LNLGDKYSHEFLIDQEVYENFMKTFRDHNPLHTDRDFAQSKGFRDVVMHGNLLNGFISYFVGELLPVKDVMIMKQEIKFRLPVYLGDVLQFSAIVTEDIGSVNAKEFKFDFTNPEGKKVATGIVLIGLI
jgi:3-hydroxybutyryl-CoA dehydratase